MEVLAPRLPMSMQDAPELPKVTLLPAMDKPMVLRSKDGGRPKRSRTDTSPPPRPATSSGTGPPLLQFPHTSCDHHNAP